MKLWCDVPVLWAVSSRFWLCVLQGMALPLDRRSRSRSPVGGLFAWEQSGPVDDHDSDEAGDQAQHLFGKQLEDHLLSQFALGQLDAKALCIACWFASKAGAQGDGLARLAFPPGRSTGNYSRHLKAMLPIDLSDLVPLDVPAYVKGARTTKTILVAAPHVVLEAEANVISAVDSDAVKKKLEGTEWTDAYLEHPLREKAGDDRLVVPCALYLDGIKFTRAIGPRQDTLLGVTMYSILTGSRHLICTLSKRELCGCGCRGWDTIMSVFEFVRWSMEVPVCANPSCSRLVCLGRRVPNHLPRARATAQGNFQVEEQVWCVDTCSKGSRQRGVPSHRSGRRTDEGGV